MPRSYDLNPVAITHHPTQRIDTAIGKLPPFDLEQVVDGFLRALKDLTGIDLTGIRDFLENLFGSIDWSHLPTPEAAWGFVVDTFIQPIINVVEQIKSGLTSLVGPLFGGIDFTGELPTPEEVWSTVVSTFINPLINVVEAVANALLTAPLNAANLFGRIALPQFGSGVPIMSLTTAVPNELEPFTAESVPSEDGWSFNASEDAAQMVCDGSLKTLYMKSGVIKVEEGQPLDTSIRVKYSGIVSGAGQAIRYVLETFTTDDGSGAATPVVVGAVSNPSGTITTPVTLGDSSWDIPVGVKSVRPALVGDELLAAGTVFWLNTPALYKKLDPVFAGGLPAVLNNLGDWIETLVDQLLGALGLPALGSLFDKIMDLGDEIEGWFDDTLNTASDLAGLIGDLLSNPASVLGNLPRTLISGLEAWWDGITAKTVNLTSGGFFDAGKLANITGTLSQSLVTGLTDLATQANQVTEILAGQVVTPINELVQAVKDWFHSWFGGGSTQAIPLNQKGATNGVATLDSSGNVPLSQLGNAPGGGGGSAAHPHVLLTRSSTLSIPNATPTDISGWVQSGSAEVTFDDGSNTRFSFPEPGWWSIESQVVWAASGTGVRQAALGRVLSDTSTSLVEVDGVSASSFVAFGAPRNTTGRLHDVSDNAPLDASDKFKLSAYQNSGGALNIVPGYPDGTYLLATFIGDRLTDEGVVGPVLFDASGTGAVGTSSSDSISWSHTASGTDRAVIVTLAYNDGSTRTASYGGTAMLSLGRVQSSTFFLEFFILLSPPTGTNTVTTTVTGSNGYLVGNSLSYTGVGGYGTLLTTTGIGASLTQNVASAPNRMVVQGFFNRTSTVSLSGYSQSQRYGLGRTAIHAVIGDANGAATVNFSATQGVSTAWAGAAVNLLAVGE